MRYNSNHINEIKTQYSTSGGYISQKTYNEINFFYLIYLS